MSVYIKGSNTAVISKVPIFLDVRESKTPKISSLSLGGSGISFTLDDDIPLVGGQNFDFNLPVSLPVSWVIEDNTLKVGINIIEKELYSANSVEGVTTSNKVETVVDKLKKESLKEKYEDWKKEALTASYSGL